MGAQAKWQGSWDNILEICHGIPEESNNLSVEYGNMPIVITMHASLWRHTGWNVMKVQAACDNVHKLYDKTPVPDEQVLVLCFNLLVEVYHQWHLAPYVC